MCSYSTYLSRLLSTTQIENDRKIFFTNNQGDALIETENLNHLNLRYFKIAQCSKLRKRKSIKDHFQLRKLITEEGFVRQQ